MKYIGKKISLLLIVSILLGLSFSTVSAGANSTIYQTSTTEVITSGVTLEKISRLTDEGWLNINVLRVSLDNKNVKVDTISSQETIKKLTNVKELAESNGAVAAVNASFFNWMKEAGYAYPDGPVVQSGKMVSADRDYNRYNDSMGTFSISNLNEVMYNFWKTDMEIIAPDGTAVTVSKFNKPSTNNYNEVVIFDRKWTQYSPGTSTDYSDLVEMVVDGGKVTRIRRGLPSVEIPENGYVVVTRGDKAEFIVNNFKLNDKVGLSISTTPDWSKLEMAVTGSAILVKDGKIPSKFSYNINGRHPRTAVGSTRSGKYLLLVTVDGRQNASIGMTQTELAELMISLGAHNALNLDGGGSTTMVARSPGTDSINTINKPSDGSLRKVANAIGIFSMFPTSSLDGLIIDTVDTNVFVNTSREFSVKGYDKYFNPVEIKPEQVKWTVKGIVGSFKNNTFYPESEGEGIITATVGNISSSTEIKSLGNPSSLVLSNRTLKMVRQKKHTFTIQGADKNGYTTYINPEDVNWSVIGNIGTMDKNTFTAQKDGVGFIDASIGDTHAYCTVSVAEESLSVRDGFESLNGSFLSYPEGTLGNYEISSEIKIVGNYSGKLTYDFTSLEGTRAAYLVFSNNGIDLAENVTKVGIWVNNPRENANWLRAEVYDAEGKKHMLDFIRGMNWTGWKYLEASLGSISLPARLTRIYTVQVDPIPESGYFYLDQLSLKSSSFPEIDEGKVPQDTMPVDETNKQVEFKKTDDSFKFTVFSQKGEPSNLLEKIMQIRFAEKIDSDTETLALLGQASKTITNIVNTPSISTGSSYNSTDISGSRLIQLNTSGKSLRTSSTGQWQWFINKLNTFNGKNIFIFMKYSPSSFGDSREGNLFKKILSDYKDETGKSIWVFYHGDTDKSFMDNGIKYFSLKGLDTKDLNPDNADKVKYIEVIVNKDMATYQYKPVID